MITNSASIPSAVPSIIIAAVTIGLSMLVLIALALVWLCKCKRQKRHLDAKSIHTLDPEPAPYRGSEIEDIHKVDPFPVVSTVTRKKKNLPEKQQVTISANGLPATRNGVRSPLPGIRPPPNAFTLVWRACGPPPGPGQTSASHGTKLPGRVKRCRDHGETQVNPRRGDALPRYSDT